MRGLVLIEILSKYFATAFQIVFFLNLDNLKKHLLRFGILELKFFEFPHFAKPFSVGGNFIETVIQKKMPDKNEIERRKQIKKVLREKAKTEFENSLPISKEKFTQLFDFLDEKLGEYDCDDSLKLTNEFLRKNKIKNVKEIENWFQKNGGYCDCEVLNNVEEMFDEDAIL